MSFDNIKYFLFTENCAESEQQQRRHSWAESVCDDFCNKLVSAELLSTASTVITTAAVAIT